MPGDIMLIKMKKVRDNKIKEWSNTEIAPYTGRIHKERAAKSTVSVQDILLPQIQPSVPPVPPVPPVRPRLIPPVPPAQNRPPDPRTD